MTHSAEETTDTLAVRRKGRTLHAGRMTGVRCAVGLPNVGEYGDPQRLVSLAQQAESAGWDGLRTNGGDPAVRPDPHRLDGGQLPRHRQDSPAGEDHGLGHQTNLTLGGLLVPDRKRVSGVV